MGRAEAILFVVLISGLTPACLVAPTEQCDPGDFNCNGFGSVLLYLPRADPGCGDIDWSQPGATSNCWHRIQDHLLAEQESGDCGVPTTQLIGDVFPTTQKWSSGVLTPAGEIRGIVQNVASGQLLKITPATGSATLSGAATSLAGWRGGVLAPNGNIFAVPSNAAGTLIEYDPLAETASEFTGIASVGNAQRGAVLAPNGFIYSIPSAHTAVLKINPDDRTTVEINVGSGGWEGGTLGPDGLIYAAPGSASSILVIDPSDDSVRTIGSGLTGYAGVLLAPNGKLYFVPNAATSVLVLDPVTETTYTFGGLPGGAEDWVHGALGANGKIYAPPGQSTNTVLEIDTRSDTVTQIATTTTLAQRWWGPVAALDGKVYAVPFTGTQVLEIDPCAGGKILSDVLLSSFYNKW